MDNISMIFDARHISQKHCGVQKVSIDMINSLCRNQKNFSSINLILSKKNKVPDQLLEILNKNKFIKIIHIPFCSSRFSPLSYLVLTLTLPFIKFTHFVSPYAWIPFFNLIPARKTFFVCHDLFALYDNGFHYKYARLKKAYLRLLLYISLFNCNYVVVPSKAIFNNLEERYKKNSYKIRIITNLLPQSFKSEKLSMKLDSYYRKHTNFIFVGNLKSYKGFDILFNSWKYICLKNNQFGLNNTLNVISNDIRVLDFEKKNIPSIKIHYRPSDEIKDKIFFNSDVAIIPSRSEGFGFPYAEAIMSNIPIVISSDIPSFSEIDQQLNFNSLSKSIKFISGSSLDLSRALIDSHEYLIKNANDILLIDDNSTKENLKRICSNDFVRYDREINYLLTS